MQSGKIQTTKKGILFGVVYFRGYLTVGGTFGGRIYLGEQFFRGKGIFGGEELLVFGRT